MGHSVHTVFTRLLRCYASFNVANETHLTQNLSKNQLSKRVFCISFNGFNTSN